MDQRKESKFSVIELLEPPYTDSDKYVCVPISWIRLRETEDGIALVKFPTEKLSETKKRVKKEENFSDDWSILLADVKYSTDSYKDANEFIKILDKIFILNRRCSKRVREDKPSVPDNEILDLLPESKTKEICATSDQLSNDPELMNNQTTSQQLKVSTSELGVCQEITKIVDLADSTDKTKRYLTRQSLRMSSPTNNFRLLDQIEKLTFEKTSKSIKKSGTVEHNKEKAPLVRTPPELTNESGILSALRSLLGDNYKEILQNLHSEFENNQKMLYSLQLSFSKNCVLLKKLIDMIEQVSDCDEIDHNVAIKELKNHMVREVNTKTKNVENNEEKTGLEVQPGDENVTDGNGGKKNNKSNPLNKIRGQARKFTLPPEYDPNNSKWSLKHHKKILLNLYLNQVYT